MLLFSFAANGQHVAADSHLDVPGVHAGHLGAHYHLVAFDEGLDRRFTEQRVEALHRTRFGPEEAVN